MNTNQLMSNAPDPVTVFLEFAHRMEKTENPSQEDLCRFRQLAVSSPKVWSLVIRSMDSIRHQLVKKISDIMAGCALLAEVDILKKKLGYDTSPPLEQLLIDHILTARLRVIHAENCYNTKVVNQDISFKTGEYWDNQLSSAHARYLKAVETLAKVRKMARNTPSLQINIAQDGGKQVNVQGDVKAQGIPEPPVTQ